MTTPPVVRDVHTLRPGDHVCLSYASNAQQQRVMASFVRDGLAAGEKVLWVTDTGTSATVAAMLLRHGIDPADHVQRRQVEVVSADEVLLAGGYFDPDRAVDGLRARMTGVIRSGFPALRITGDMTWALRDVPGTERLLEYETKLCLLFLDHPAMAVCQYDARLFAPQALAAFTRAHGGQIQATARGSTRELVDAGTTGAGAAYARVRITRTEEPLGLRVAGEVDLTCHEVLGEALATVVTESTGDIHLDLSGLGFIDAAGVRLLVVSAAGLSPERRLLVYRPSPQLRRVLRFVRCDQTRRLVLIGGDQ